MLVFHEIASIKTCFTANTCMLHMLRLDMKSDEMVSLKSIEKFMVGDDHTSIAMA